MKISLIIPFYNVAPYLRECLDSVLAQTYTDWEAICVDDGSVDGSDAILDEYAAEDGRFIVIHQKNSGVSIARNRGFGASHGEWVLFMDSDDVIVQNALAKVADAITRNDCEMVTFEMCRVKDVNESVPEKLDFEETVHDMECEGGAVPFVRKNFPYRLWAWNKCINRSLIGDLRFENYQPCEDAVFTLICIMRARRIVELPHVLYKYLQHDGSCLSRVSPKRIDGNLNGMCRLTEVMLGWRYFRLIKSDVSRTMRNGFLIWLTNDLRNLTLGGDVDGHTLSLLRRKYALSVRSVFIESNLFVGLHRFVYRLMFGACELERVSNYLRFVRQIQYYANLPCRCMGAREFPVQHAQVSR